MDSDPETYIELGPVLSRVKQVHFFVYIIFRYIGVNLVNWRRPAKKGLIAHKSDWQPTQGGGGWK